MKTRLRLGVKKGALVVPAAAVQRGPQGTFVYVVGDDGKAHGRSRSRSTRSRATTRCIAKGLDAGERVVTEGQNQLRPGAKVTVRQPGGDEPAVTAAQRRHRAAAAEERARIEEGHAMNVSEPFIRRPIGTSLLMVGVLIAGVVGYSQLPVSALPQVDYPTIAVTTLLPGASAETMVSAVTTPLERQLGQIPSLAQLTSVSSAATSLITLQFTLDRDIDSAEQDVQAAINAASNLLPRTLPTPPTYSKSNPADVPVIALGVSSDTRAARARRRLRRLDPGAEDLAGQRRRPGDAERRPAARRARAGRSGGAGGARAHARGRARDRWSPPTSTSRRATSTGRASTTPSPPTISCSRRRRTGRSSSPTATARRCGCPTSRRCWTASRTRSSPAGPTATARSS